VDYQPGEPGRTFSGRFPLEGSSDLTGAGAIRRSSSRKLKMQRDIAARRMDFLTNARVGGTWTVNGQHTCLRLVICDDL
jgi:hypothetical protein